MDNWPSDIPQAFIHESFSATPMSGVIQTEMDTGKAKRRRRFTAVTEVWSGNMVMTSTQLATFKTFFNTTIKLGSLSFNFPNQFNLTQTVEARFNNSSGDTPFTIAPDGETLDWSISFSLEVTL